VAAYKGNVPRLWMVIGVPPNRTHLTIVGMPTTTAPLGRAERAGADTTSGGISLTNIA